MSKLPVRVNFLKIIFNLNYDKEHKHVICPDNIVINHLYKMGREKWGHKCIGCVEKPFLHLHSEIVAIHGNSYKSYVNDMINQDRLAIQLI